MSLPYHRGQVNNKNNSMSYRGSNQWGTKNQIADEANRNLLEEENDRRWSDLGINILVYYYNHAYHYHSQENK